MSLYRNKDVNKPKPTSLLTAFLLIAGGIAALFQQDFATPLRMVLISTIAAATLMGIYFVWLWLPARMRTATTYIVEQHRQEQGRLTPKEAEQKGLLMEESGLPLASLMVEPAKRCKKMIGLNSTALEGHALIVGATRSGKGMHLTQTLLSSDCAAVVIDPKGEQYERTAGYRAEHVGPVYKIPGNTLDLADYYNLAHNDHLTELHFHLMKPWADKQSIFADKVKFVFAAAQAYARDNQLNPLHVLLDAADSSPADALGALLDSH
ncbi:MAG: type IV secretory system conjugative DNA transfer family protein, partial [Anaerolineales bacterium]|nr:type IV secretory system conjugative DNA transfer family protein [Anaerolineales bacterium]